MRSRLVPAHYGLGAKVAAIHPDYVVHQIKEKFGTLRFCAETKVEGDRLERFDTLMSEAEARSGRICEQCGSNFANLCLSGIAFYRHEKTLCDSCCVLLNARCGET